jgi:hypothetical protein
MSDIRDHVCIIPERILFDLTLTLLDLRLYGLISSYMYTTGKFYEGNKKIATRFGVEMRSIPRSIARLIKKGYLEANKINGKRHLKIKQTPMPEASVSPPEHDPEVMPPMTLGSPPHDPNVTQSLPSINTISIENILLKKDIELIFQKMWEAYPHKKARAKALEALIKILDGKPRDEGESLAKTICHGLMAHIGEHRAKQDLKKQGANIWIPELPYLSTWLNGRRWEDEYQSPESILLTAERKKPGLDLEAFEAQWH